ncbi:hypothetical protein [Streptomyces sp. NPDC003635]
MKAFAAANAAAWDEIARADAAPWKTKMASHAVALQEGMGRAKVSASAGVMASFGESQDEEGGVDPGRATRGPGPVDDVSLGVHDHVVRGKVGVQEGVSGEEVGGSGRSVWGPALFGGLDGDVRGGGDLLEFFHGRGDEWQVDGAGGVVGVPP